MWEFPGDCSHLKPFSLLPPGKIWWLQHRTQQLEEGYHLLYFSFCLAGMGKDARELLEASKDGNVPLVNQILAARARRPRTPLSFLKSPSCWLCTTKDLTTGYTPLHLAAVHGHSQVTRLHLVGNESRQFSLTARISASLMFHRGDQ